MITIILIAATINSYSRQWYDKPNKKDIIDYENDLINFVNKIETILKTISNYIKPINKLSKLLFKLTNQELPMKEVLCFFKTTNNESGNYINKRVKIIATKLKLDNRIKQLMIVEPFIKLRYHKDTFVNKPTHRLLIPTKLI